MFIYYLIIVLPAVTLFSLGCYIPIILIEKCHNIERPFVKRLFTYFFLIILCSILYITVFLYGFALDFHPEYHLLNLVPFIWVKETYLMGFASMIKQLISNIIMLVPFGCLLPVVIPKARKWWRVILTTAIFITLIETLQYFTGRSADVDDVIMNTLGGWIGYLIFLLAGKLFEKFHWWQTLIE